MRIVAEMAEVLRSAQGDALMPVRASDVSELRLHVAIHLLFSLDRSPVGCHSYLLLICRRRANCRADIDRVPGRALIVAGLLRLASPCAAEPEYDARKQPRDRECADHHKEQG